MESTTNADFKIHLQTFLNVAGIQIGDNKGKDLIFINKNNENNTNNENK